MEKIIGLNQEVKKLLLCSVAVMGISSAAQAQMLDLQGLLNNGKVESHAGLYLPFGTASSGLVFMNVGAGLLNGNKNGEIIGGYGQSLGSNAGLRGYAGIGLQEGKNHYLFTAGMAGMELIVGGFGFHLSGSVPFGNIRQMTKKGHTDGVLVDPSGQQCDPTGGCTPLPPSCSNPLPGQPKRCEVAIAVTAPSYEKALKGFEVEMDYQMQMDGIFITPSVGYYRYGLNEVSGVKTGLDVSIPLTGQLSLNIVAGGNKKFKGDNKGISGYGGLGVSYHFGTTPLSQSSGIEHRFNQAPNRNQRYITTQTHEGQTMVYHLNDQGQEQGFYPSPPPFLVTWDLTRQAISEIIIVDQSNETMAPAIVAAAKEGAVVVFDGSKGRIRLTDTVKLSQNYQGMVGGGATLNLNVSRYGGPPMAVPLTLPGNRGNPVQQTDLTKPVFTVENVTLPIFHNLWIEGGSYSIEAKNIKQLSLIYVKAYGAKLAGFKLDYIDQAHLERITYDTLGTSSDGLLINHSQYIVADDLWLIEKTTGKGKIALGIADTKNMYIMNSYIDGFGFGMLTDSTANIQVEKTKIQNVDTGISLGYDSNFFFVDSQILNAKNVAIDVAYSRGPAVFKNVDITTTGGSGILTHQAQVELLDTRIVGNRGMVAIGIQESYIGLSNVKVMDFNLAYNLYKTVVADRGGNQVSLITKICDGVKDSDDVRVFNTDDGKTYTCN